MFTKWRQEKRVIAKQFSQCIDDFIYLFFGGGAGWGGEGAEGEAAKRYSSPLHTRTLKICEGRASPPTMFGKIKEKKKLKFEIEYYITTSPLYRVHQS